MSKPLNTWERKNLQHKLVGVAFAIATVVSLIWCAYVVSDDPINWVALILFGLAASLSLVIAILHLAMVAYRTGSWRR